MHKKLSIMMHAILPIEFSTLSAIKYQSSVSIIIPFEPKMSVKNELEFQLRLTCKQVERELNDKYPPEKVIVVMDKLKQLIKTLDYSTYKKSIAIFVSPIAEKVFYLDIEVEKKIIVDD